jgi:hypothetical protein
MSGRALTGIHFRILDATAAISGYTYCILLIHTLFIAIIEVPWRRVFHSISWPPDCPILLEESSTDIASVQKSSPLQQRQAR